MVLLLDGGVEALPAPVVLRSVRTIDFTEPSEPGAIEKRGPGPPTLVALTLAPGPVCRLPWCVCSRA